VSARWPPEALVARLLLPLTYEDSIWVNDGDMTGVMGRGSGEWSRMLTDPSLPGVEALQARYFQYRYAPHWHEALCVAVVCTGGAAFECGGVTHVAPAGSVFVIPAYEVHTGQPDERAGLGYRVLYIRPAQVADLLAHMEIAGRGAGKWPKDTVRRGATAVGPLLRFHQSLTTPAWPLEREHALLSAVAAVAAEFDAGLSTLPSYAAREHRAVRLARDYLHAHPAEVITLRDLAKVTGMSMYHLARTFKAEIGMAPHAYQVQLRVLEAKRLLAAGCSAAEAAAECGFYDQAHLIGQFKRHVGLTPGAYARSVSGSS
jgi:AraC-like DNA-binding protein